MAEQDILPGNRFRLYRKNSGGTFDFVCLATALTFTRTAETADATTVDCDNPTAVPNTRFVKTRRGWTLNFSGKSDPKKLELIETDYEAEDSHEYQILVDRTAARGGKTYTGKLHITSLELGRPENGMVTFSCQCTGDGAYTTAAAAA
jgi:Phage tail tube protein